MVNLFSVLHLPYQSFYNFSTLSHDFKFLRNYCTLKQACCHSSYQNHSKYDVITGIPKEWCSKKLFSTKMYLHFVTFNCHKSIINGPTINYGANPSGKLQNIHAFLEHVALFVIPMSTPYNVKIFS